MFHRQRFVLCRAVELRDRRRCAPPRSSQWLRLNPSGRTSPGTARLRAGTAHIAGQHFKRNLRGFTVPAMRGLTREPVHVPWKSPWPPRLIGSAAAPDFPERSSPRLRSTWSKSVRLLECRSTASPEGPERGTAPRLPCASKRLDGVWISNLRRSTAPSRWVKVQSRAPLVATSPASGWPVGSRLNEAPIVVVRAFPCDHDAVAGPLS